MFETVLAGHAAPRRRALAGPLSVALHACVIAAIVAASAWRLTDPGEPNLRITLFDSEPPPPPAGAAAEQSPGPIHGHALSLTRPAPDRPAPLAPSVIPVRVDSLPEPAPLGLLPGGDTGPGQGTRDGVEGGTGGPASRGGGAGVPPISAAAPNVVPPRLLSEARPEYPEAARRIREQGIVLLQAVIGASGAVEEVRVVSSSSSLFDEAAIRAVRQWRYTPATLDGRAVRVFLTVTIRFDLH